MTDLDTKYNETQQTQETNTFRLEDVKTEKPILKNGRLVFKDWKHFVDTWQSLNLLSLKEIKSWEENLRFQSLRNFNQDTMNVPRLKEYRLPDAYQAVINPDGEVQIGNIISVSKVGHKYFMFDKHEDILVKLKTNQLQASEEKAKGIVKADFPIPTGTTEKSMSNGRLEGSAVLGGNQYRDVFWEYSTSVTFRVTFGLINRLDLEPFAVGPGIVIGWNSYLETYILLHYWRRNFWGQWRMDDAGENTDKWIRNLNMNIVPPTAQGLVVAPPQVLDISLYSNSNWTIGLGSASSLGTCNTTPAYCPTWNILSYSGDYECRVYPHYNQYAPHTSNKSIGLYREPAFFQ